MPRTLYITTELPCFPGQAGVMAQHMAHLSATGLTGVAGPRYPHQSEIALQRLRDTVQRSYWWPEHPVPGDIPAAPAAAAPPAGWLRLLPRPLKLRLLRRLTGLHRYSDDALAWRIVLVNLAPKILEALHGERWNAVLLAQSTSAAWLPFLPASLARCLYFHDIRSDYLRRTPDRPAHSRLRRVWREESIAVHEVEAAAFVSELDRTRAAALLAPPCPTAVAPLCLDLDYFSFRPTPASAEPIVLFTGHLSHPPNLDAVLHLLAAIWPRILAALPGARLKIVGAQPAPALTAATAGAAGVELIPNVPDIRPYFHSARVYVVPMRYGGGVRNKIIEAWALGLPVITTTMGAEGLDAQDGVNCWIRDDPAAFADQVVALLQGSVPAAVPAAARAVVEQNHSPAASCPPLAALLATATRRRRESPPRVLFDLRWLKPGHAGGVEQMTRALVDELACFDRTFEYRFLGPEAVCRPWRFPAGFRHRMICPDGASERRRARRDALAGRLAADLSLPPLVSPELQALDLYTRLDFTVVHGLPGYVHPDLRRFPAVVTMHDLQHLHRPDFFPPEDIATREREYRESCRLAAHVICTSEFTRQDVHRRYGVPLEKMTTVWNLPGPAGTPLAPAAASRLLQGMRVKPPFLFYPAQPWRHKNHHGLLAAFRLADSSLPADCQLVLTGQPLPADHPAASLLADPLLSRRVVHLGYRSPREIAALYQSAEALVFPSLFEGFGLPVLEAMQQGCPVICGAHTSLPEIAGEAAVLADVASPAALAAAMVSVTRDPATRATLRQRGRENLRRFDRRALAEKTRTIYALVHEQHFA